MTGEFDVKALIKRKPISTLAWASIFFVGAALNFKMGRELFGIEIGLAFVAVAVLGAYAATTLEGESNKVRRAGLVALMGLQLALGQWCGWQQLGLNMARSLSTLSSEAGVHNTSAEALKAAREQRAALGNALRPIGAIEADLALEIKKTSRTYKDGCGPNCTKLKNELEAAKKASELDARLPDLAQAAADAPQIADPDAPFAVPMSFGSAIGSWWHGKPVQATAKDVVFWFSIFMIVLLEFIATCGPWIFRFHAAMVPEGMPDAVNPFDFGPRQLTYRASGVPEMPPHIAALAAADRNAVGGVPPGRGPVEASQPGEDGLHPPLATPAAAPSPSSVAGGSMQGGAVHGAPITINLGGGPFPPSGAASGAGTTALPAPEVLDRVADRNVKALQSVQPRLVADPVSPAVPDTPTDRSVLVATLDSLAVFKAAHLLPQQGAWVEAGAMYQRYQEWAQSRAISPEAFHTLFAAATGTAVHSLGGQPHYADVVLKRPRLAVAAGG